MQILEAHHGHDSRNDRNLDSRLPRPLDEAEEKSIVQEELGDQELDPGLDLLAEIREILLEARRFVVLLGVAGAPQAESEAALDERCQLVRMAESTRDRVRVRLIPGQISAQGEHVLDPRALHPLQAVGQLLGAATGTGHVGHRRESDFPLNSIHQVCGLLARRSGSAACHRDEARLERRQIGNGAE